MGSKLLNASRASHTSAGVDVSHATVASLDSAAFAAELRRSQATPLPAPRPPVSGVCSEVGHSYRASKGWCHSVTSVVYILVVTQHWCTRLAVLTIGLGVLLPTDCRV